MPISENANKTAPTKAPNFKPSDDGFNFLQVIRASMAEGNLEWLSEAVQMARDLVESGFYDRSALRWIDYEQERARSAIKDLGITPSVQPKPPLTPAQVQVNFFRLKTKCSSWDIWTICDRLNYPKTSLEITESQAIVIVSELLIKWAVESKWIDREIAAGMVLKSIARAKTDEGLWDDLALSIESYELEPEILEFIDLRQLKQS